MNPKPFRITPFFVDTAITPGFDFEKFNKALDNLSQSLLDILLDQKTYETIVGISEKYQLNDQQSEDLSRVIRDVVITEIFIEDMPMAIRDKLKVDDTVAQDMAQTILNQLFQPVLEELKQNHGAKFKFRLNSRAQTPAQPQTQAPAYQAPQRPMSANTQPIPEKESIVNNIDSNIINLRKP